MKLHSIIIFRRQNGRLDVYKEAYEVSTVSFFHRGKTRELLKFLSTTVAGHVSAHKLCITEKEYVMYVENNGEYCAIVTTDADYPARCAFSIADKVWRDIVGLDLVDMIEEYQDPNKADAILRIQKSLDMTKVIMLDAIDKVLERNEKIDDLVVRSATLSDGSKVFYQEAKKMNSWCCVIA